MDIFVIVFFCQKIVPFFKFFFIILQKRFLFTQFLPSDVIRNFKSWSPIATLIIYNFYIYIFFRDKNEFFNSDWWFFVNDKLMSMHEVSEWVSVCDIQNEYYDSTYSRWF